MTTPNSADQVTLRFRKRPVEIYAVHVVPENDDAILAFMGATMCPFEITGPYEMVIHTLEGDMHLSQGDWLIQGVKGEFYPCKPDIFEVTRGEA